MMDCLDPNFYPEEKGSEFCPPYAPSINSLLHLSHKGGF